jgi:acyl carrier protein
VGFIKLEIHKEKENMNMAEIEDRLKTIIVEKLDVPVERIFPMASFTGDLGADSLDMVELVMALEEEFGLDISDETAEKLTRYKDVIDFIEMYLQPMEKIDDRDID